MELADLIAGLSDADSATRCRAAEQLSRHEQAAAAAVPLVRAAGDPDDAVREWAVAALEACGPPSPTDLPAIIRLLEAEQADVAYWAATLIGRLQAEASAAVPALIQSLGSSPAEAVRQRAAWALGQIGSAAAPAVPALRKAAASQNARLARLARAAVDQIAQ